MALPTSFEGVESRNFEPLPVGKYPVEVSNAAYNPANEPEDKSAYVSWEFTVKGGEYDNRKGFLNSSLQVADEAKGKKDARWATMRVLTAIGFTDEEIKSRQWDFEDPATLDSFIGRECIMSIGHQMYEGEKTQRVRRVSPVKAGESIGTEAPF